MRQMMYCELLDGLCTADACERACMCMHACDEKTLLTCFTQERHRNPQHNEGGSCYLQPSDHLPSRVIAPLLPLSLRESLLVFAHFVCVL